MNKDLKCKGKWADPKAKDWAYGRKKTMSKFFNFKKSLLMRVVVRCIEIMICSREKRIEGLRNCFWLIS
jgi:hypothetical protein